MNERSLIISALIILMITGCTVPLCLADKTNATGSELLIPVSKSLQQALDTIDQNLSTIAKEFGDTNSSPDTLITADQVNQPGWAGVILINGDTVYTTLNPSVVTSTLNTSLTEDAAIADSITYLKPKMGQLRDISDADQGVVVSRPTVINDRIGTAVALIIPWSLGEAVVRPLTNGTENLVVVMQGDGTILYTTHPGELTKIPPDTFSTEFPTFRDVRTAMIQKKEGQMIYELWRAERGDPLERDAYWTTISLHGNEWRVLFAERSDNVMKAG